MQPHPSYDMMGVAALKIQVTLSHDCASLSLGTRRLMTSINKRMVKQKHNVQTVLSAVALSCALLQYDHLL